MYMHIYVYKHTQVDTSPGVVFRLDLPPLVQGVHTLQAFVLHPKGDRKQELNQSPLQFAEVCCCVCAVRVSMCVCNDVCFFLCVCV